MKRFRSKEVTAPADATASSPVGRRGVVVGAGVAGAAAIAAAALHRGFAVADAEPQLVKPERDAQAGYSETPHVLRYYETTRG